MRRRIRLSEGQLRRVIKESVYRILNEEMEMDGPSHRQAVVHLTATIKKYRDYKNFRAGELVDKGSAEKAVWGKTDEDFKREAVKKFYEDMTEWWSEKPELKQTDSDNYYSISEKDNEILEIHVVKVEETSRR